jgi:heme exporter protein CcmD
MLEFFRMGGYAGYVWSCYGLTLAVLAGNLWHARRELANQVQRATRRNTASGTGSAS